MFPASMPVRVVGSGLGPCRENQPPPKSSIPRTRAIPSRGQVFGIDLARAEGLRGGARDPAGAYTDVFGHAPGRAAQIRGIMGTSLTRSRWESWSGWWERQGYSACAWTPTAAGQAAMLRASWRLALTWSCGSPAAEVRTGRVIERGSRLVRKVLVLLFFMFL